jgi:hypothetical protein
MSREPVEQLTAHERIRPGAAGLSRTSVTIGGGHRRPRGTRPGRRNSTRLDRRAGGCPRHATPSTANTLPLHGRVLPMSPECNTPFRRHLPLTAAQLLPGYATHGAADVPLCNSSSRCSTGLVRLPGGSAGGKKDKEDHTVRTTGRHVIRVTTREDGFSNRSDRLVFRTLLVVVTRGPEEQCDDPAEYAVIRFLGVRL